MITFGDFGFGSAAEFDRRRPPGGGGAGEDARAVAAVGRHCAGDRVGAMRDGFSGPFPSFVIRLHLEGEWLEAIQAIPA